MSPQVEKNKKSKCFHSLFSMHNVLQWTNVSMHVQLELRWIYTSYHSLSDENVNCVCFGFIWYMYTATWKILTYAPAIYCGILTRMLYVDHVEIDGVHAILSDNGMTNTCFFSIVVHLNLNNNDLLELLLFFLLRFYRDHVHSWKQKNGCCLIHVDCAFLTFDKMLHSSQCIVFLWFVLFVSNATPVQWASVWNEQWTVVHLPFPNQFFHFPESYLF